MERRMPPFVCASWAASRLLAGRSTSSCPSLLTNCCLALLRSNVAGFIVTGQGCWAAPLSGESLLGAPFCARLGFFDLPVGNVSQAGGGIRELGFLKARAKAVEDATTGQKAMTSVKRMRNNRARTRSERFSAKPTAANGSGLGRPPGDARRARAGSRVKARGARDWSDSSADVVPPGKMRSSMRASPFLPCHTQDAWRQNAGTHAGFHPCLLSV